MKPWIGKTSQHVTRPQGAEWLRVGLRLLWIFISIFLLILPMYLLRIGGFKRSSQALVRIACRASLRAMGLTLQVHGTPMRGAGAIVSNHVSWMDIFVMNAVHNIYFVAKADVAGWPVIGMIARSVGTVFIRRKISDAAQQKAMFVNRVGQGDRLFFFPEGTSTDGQQVLPFKSTLFAAFFDEALKETMLVQPVTLRYVAAAPRDPWFYCWWGDMEFVEHFLMILASDTKGAVQITFHEPFEVADFSDRKRLAKAAEDAVRSGLGP